MHLSHSRAILVVVGLCFLPAAGSAQTSDSVLFHRGQWGTEFSISAGFAAAGLLYFTSPGRAFLVDLGTDYSHDSRTLAGVGASSEDVGVVIRLGTRGYRSFGRRLYRLATVGVSFNYSWHTFTQDTLRITSQGVGGGVFADIGATWLVTPHLGLGAKVGVAATYTRATFSSPGGSGSDDRFGVSAGHVALVGQLYF